MNNHNAWTHWAESAEQNQAPIGAAIEPYLSAATHLLELGSGSGQHAVAFATQHPQLRWQPTEHPSNLAALSENLRHHGPSNLAQPLALDASAAQWPTLRADLFYSSNTLHIMSWEAVKQLFVHLSALLEPGQQALFYGPFRFDERPFAPSNHAFDQLLRQRDPQSGIRDVTALQDHAASLAMTLNSDIEMPCNNHILVWDRIQE